MSLRRVAKTLDPLNIGVANFFPDKEPEAGPAIPPIPEPAVAPVADDRAIKAKQRRKAARIRQRSGRLSTINTAPQGTVLG